MAGGRGSAKSWDIAAELIELSTQKKLRVMCCREIQRSIKDSSHKLLCDTIEREGLQAYFDVTETSIKSYLGGEFIFKGLYNNLDSIQSIEGIDICWLEEAQSVSKKALVKLRPTIRKAGSEIWASYNPNADDDPIHEFAGCPEPDDYNPEPTPEMTVLFQNYYNNPFLPDVLKLEEHMDRKRDPEIARHVWDGYTLKFSDAEIFGGRWEVRDFITPELVTFYHGFDFGFSTDPNALIRCFIIGNDLYIDRAKYWYESELPEMAESISEYCPTVMLDGTPKQWKLWCDSARPELIKFLRKGEKKPVNAYSVGAKQEIMVGIKYIRSFDNIIVHKSLSDMIFELKKYKFKEDPKTGDVLPIPIDKHNHLCDALRYALKLVISKGAHNGD